MIGILSQTTSPAFNLATEEYLLKEIKEDVFYIYVNEPSIIVGKHQNTLAEINYNYTLSNNIPVYRRLSGGGTVYHDLGNLNFCFITNEKKGNLVNFDKHSAPIVKALENIGLTIEVGKRHDLGIADKKITGTASHVFKTRSIHHGTLLFNTDLIVLNRCLNTPEVKYSDRAVKSIRSEVTNISEFLEQPMTMEEFKFYIFNYLMSYFQEAKTSLLSFEKDNEAINKLINDKYGNWEWNYGYSPVYKLSKSININHLTVTSNLTVEKGIISKISFTGDDKELLIGLNNFAKKIKGTQHNRNAILRAFNELSPIAPGLTRAEVLKLIF